MINGIQGDKGYLLYMSQNESQEVLSSSLPETTMIECYNFSLKTTRHLNIRELWKK